MAEKSRSFSQVDEVFGDVCDSGFGAFAEYVSVPENVLAMKPSNLNFDEAATVPQAALVALQGLRIKERFSRDKKF